MTARSSGHDTALARRAPVVLLGGVAEDEDLWTDVRRRLPGTMVLSARPSATPEGTVEAAADALAETLAEPAILVGHSMGGLTALALAARHPELALGIVLVCAGHPVTVNARIYDLLSQDPAAALVAMGVAAASDRARQRTPAAQKLARRFAAMAGRCAPADIIADLRACEACTPELSRLTEGLPVRALAGADDRMLGEELTGGLADALGVGVEVVPGVGHQLPWQRPELVAAACGELRRVILRPRGYR